MPADCERIVEREDFGDKGEEVAGVGDSEAILSCEGENVDPILFCSI